MHQADASRINPDVAAIPMSERETIWRAMHGRNGLVNLASGNPDMILPETVRKAMAMPGRKPRALSKMS